MFWKKISITAPCSATHQSSKIDQTIKLARCFVSPITLHKTAFCSANSSHGFSSFRHPTKATHLSNCRLLISLSYTIIAEILAACSGTDLLMMINYDQVEFLTDDFFYRYLTIYGKASIGKVQLMGWPCHLPSFLLLLPRFRACSEYPRSVPFLQLGVEHKSL